MTNTKRLYLLSEAEIADLYARPDFNSAERELYCAMNQIELDALSHYLTTKTRVSFILQLAYFKAKHQFFTFKFEDVRDDVEYILSNFFEVTGLVLSGTISRQCISLQKQVILKLFNYKDFSAEQAYLIEAHLYELLRYYPKGHDTFRQLLVYFDNQKIIVSSYRYLQDMFTRAFSRENERLNRLIALIPQTQQDKLSELINREDGISKLNIIRADQKNFQYTAVRAEVNKALGIADLYEFSKTFLPTLKLSKNAIRYYADLTDQYAASRLRRLSKPQQWLQTLCFVHYRYQQIMDNLITSFIYHTRDIMAAGKSFADTAMTAYSSGLVVDLPKLARFLKWFPNRKHGLNHDELNQEAYRILPEEQFLVLAKFLEKNTFDKTAAKWAFYLQSSRLFALYLRPIMLTVPFVFYKEESDIMDFINLIKKHYGSGKSPSSFKLPKNLEDSLSKTMIRYLGSIKKRGAIRIKLPFLLNLS